MWSLLYVGFVQALAIVMFNFAIYIAENTNLTSIMVQNVILVSYVIGIFRYHEPVDYIGLFGGVLLIIGVTIVILSKKWERKIDPEFIKQRNRSYLSLLIK